MSGFGASGFGTPASSSAFGASSSQPGSSGSSFSAPAIGGGSFGASTGSAPAFGTPSFGAPATTFGTAPAGTGVAESKPGPTPTFGTPSFGAPSFGTAPAGTGVAEGKPAPAFSFGQAQPGFGSTSGGALSCADFGKSSAVSSPVPQASFSFGIQNAQEIRDTIGSDDDASSIAGSDGADPNDYDGSSDDYVEGEEKELNADDAPDQIAGQDNEGVMYLWPWGGDCYEQALRYAVVAGHSKIKRALVEEGEVDEDRVLGASGGLDDQAGITIVLYAQAFVAAAEDGHTRIMRALLEEGGVEAGSRSEDGYTALACSSMYGRMDAARMLLTEWGADVNQLSGNVIAGEETTTLYCAAYKGHTDMARMLALEYSADVNKGSSDTGTTPLHAAALEGHIDIARMLVLEGGADVNQGRTVDGVGCTPLCVAALVGHIDIARMLVVEGGADVNRARTDDGWTPLYVAAHHGHTDIARMLVLEGGADVNQARTDNGCTPLFMATLKGYTQIVRMLVIDGGARVDQPDNDGARPLHYAALNGHHDVCFALAALGANMDLSPPEGFRPLPMDNHQPLAAWIRFIRGKSPLHIALERRDYAVALHLLRSRQTDPPTAESVRKELLPMASTVGDHALALPVCEKTRRVAVAAVELYWRRWSRKAHCFCGEGQREAVKAVLMIMKRTGQGVGVGNMGVGMGVGGDGTGTRRRSEGDEQEAQSLFARLLAPLLELDPHEQVGLLPRWMHSVLDDVWWHVLEMMGIQE